MNNKSYIKIIGTIQDNSTNQTVAEAFQIYDEDLSKRQSEINAEHEERLQQLSQQKEKCLGFFNTYSDLPVEDVEEGSWAIVPGTDGWYVWTYGEQGWQQSSEKYEQQEIDLAGYYTKQQIDERLSTVQNSIPTKTSQLSNDSGFVTQDVLDDYARIEDIQQQDLTEYAKKSELSNVAISGSYNDLTNKPTVSLVGTTGNYEDLTNKPDITAKIAEALEASEDAAAALSQLIEQLQSEEGATVEGILSQLNNIKDQLDDKLTEEQVLTLIRNNSGSGSGSCDCPKHIILTENEYNENDYQKDAIYFILKPGTSGGWTFGGTFPITFGNKWTFGQKFPINLT